MRAVLAGFALAFSLFCAKPVFAVVPEGRIAEAPGLRFENLVYDTANVWVSIVNMTDRNLTFGGTMIFLNRHGRPVAGASLLPLRVPRNSAKRYAGFFVEGDGESARRAVRVIWDIGPR